MTRQRGAFPPLCPALLLGLATLLAGCAAGRAVMLQPQAAGARYACGPYSIRPEPFFADGFMVMYYVIPLLPLKNNSTTPSSLELSVAVESPGEPDIELGTADVQVVIPERAAPVSPSHITSTTRAATPGKPPYRKTFRLVFDVDRHQLQAFTLVFPRPIAGCQLPDTPYVRHVERHYVTPVNR